MLSILARRGASLKPSNPKDSPLFSLPQPARTHLPLTRPFLTHFRRTRLSTSPPLQPNTLPNVLSRFSPRFHDYNGHLVSRLYTTTSMFKQAVQVHDAIASTSPTSNACKQASIGSAFNRAGPAQTSTARPLGNAAKQNTAGPPRASSPGVQGVKRASNGLAKSLGSQEDLFDYPTLSIANMEKENELPAAFHAPRANPSVLETALFDEDDFDSDVDLDVEDPATKGTVTYPTLPRVASTSSKDSGYNSRTHTADTKPDMDSSQPIPWSSSPVEHLRTPSKTEPLRVKRRTLPWQHTQKTQTIQEEDEIEEVAPPKKKQSLQADKSISTPAPKDSKSQYPWNTTASAVKQQQKAFKESMKAQAKTNQATQDDVTEAIKKKKKNTVARIFLSEEQQNVLNLVTEYKKSVFFTGSAGMYKRRFRYSLIC